MEYEHDGTQELLIDSAQEKTAKHTRHLLLAARLTFFFSHGVLIIVASVALGWQMTTSWWLIFTPAWLGDFLSLLLVVLSWFGSCPYIHLCLQERQARLGDANPSILTEILPDIFFGVLSLIYIILALIAEILLCRLLVDDHLVWESLEDTLHLQHVWHSGEPMETPTACAVFLILVSLLSCCRGICIYTSGEIFSLLGVGALASSILGMCLPSSLGDSAWVLFLPWLLVVLGLQVTLSYRLKKFRKVLCREEVLLRVAEQVLISMAFLSLVVIVVELSPYSLGGGAGTAGIALGTGICCLALLRARMLIAEHRFGHLPDRMLRQELRASEATSIRSSVISGVGAEVTLHTSSITSPTSHMV